MTKNEFEMALVEKTREVLKVEAVKALTEKALETLRELGFEILSLEEKAGSGRGFAVREWDVEASHFRVAAELRVGTREAYEAKQWPALQTTADFVVVKCLEAAGFMVIPTLLVSRGWGS